MRASFHVHVHVLVVRERLRTVCDDVRRFYLGPYPRLFYLRLLQRWLALTVSYLYGSNNRMWLIEEHRKEKAGQLSCAFLWVCAMVHLYSLD